VVGEFRTLRQAPGTVRSARKGTQFGWPPGPRSASRLLSDCPRRSAPTRRGVPWGPGQRSTAAGLSSFLAMPEPGLGTWRRGAATSRSNTSIGIKSTQNDQVLERSPGVATRQACCHACRDQPSRPGSVARPDGGFVLSTAGTGTVKRLKRGDAPASVCQRLPASVCRSRATPRGRASHRVRSVARTASRLSVSPVPLAPRLATSAEKRREVWREPGK
jgi:hypothetical protein